MKNIWEVGAANKLEIENYNKKTQILLTCTKEKKKQKKRIIQTKTTEKP